VTDKKDAKGGGESTLTVLVAMGANAGIGVLKLVAGIFTGSAAMYAEAAHSVADTATEVLLLTALKRSDRKADRRHPFGYGKERFFWALIAAVSIFVSGAVFAAFEGIRTMLGGEQEQTLAWVAYAVLAVSFVLEGTSWVQAVRQLRTRRSGTRRHRWPGCARPTTHGQDRVLRRQRGAHRPAAGVRGVAAPAHRLGLLGRPGVGAHRGAADGRRLHPGRDEQGAAHRPPAAARTVYALRDALADRPEVEQVVDLLTMTLGTDQILLCARLDFDDALDAASLERACAAIDADLRTASRTSRSLRRTGAPHGQGDPRAGAERYGQAGPTASRRVPARRVGSPSCTH
jgi:divalent metal cation (Fe/Co/Zn/Cd) transporter